MLKKIFILMGALTMAAASALPASAADTVLTQLTNGMSVLVQPDDRFPLVSLRLYVRAGSAYETDKQSGISHLLEHMVFKGTGKRAPGEVAETIEGAGGYLNAATSFDYTVYKIDLPAERLTLGLDVLRDMIFNVALDPDELESEKKVVLAELERGEDSPSSRRFKSLQPLVWEDNGYERPIIGTRESVQGISRQDILDYIGQFYQPQSMLMVVVGDVQPDAAVAEVEQFFGQLQNTGRVTPKRPLPVASHNAPRIHVEQGPWNKAYVAIAFPAPGLHSGEAVGLDMLGHLLGGDETSRLYRKFKYELGLVDDISSYALSLEQVGLFYISATLDGDKLPEFWKALNQELAGLDASVFTTQELERTRLNIENSLYSSKETLGGLASKIGYFQFFEGSLEAEENYLYTLGGVTTDQMQTLVDKYLTRDALAVSALIPENGVDLAEVKNSLAGTVDAAWTKGSADKAAAANTLGRGKTETIDLGGGHTLVLLPDGTLPYTSIAMAYKGGDSLLFPDEQGLADLTSRSLTRGTGNLSANDYEDYLSDRAAVINASASRDMFVIGAKFPSRFSEELLPLFKETLTSPALAEAEVERAKQEQIAAIKQREDQPTGLAFRHLFPMLFSDTAYSYFHRGTVDGVAKYTAAQTVGFWERQSAQSWIMSVCGDFDREAIVSLARELATENQAQDFAYSTPNWGKEFNKNLTMPDRNQSHIVVSFPVPGSRHEDAVGLDLLRQALAGQGGMLFRELRDKQGLGYTVTALLWQAPESGFLAFYIGTYPDKTEQALAGFETAVADLHANTLSVEEIDRAKNLLEGDYYREHQSLSSRSSEAAGLLVRGFPLDYNRTSLDKARTLTPKDLQNLAKKYLIWDKGYTLTVTP
ncbi:M16 family metallopeptidase [Desulfovibrio ferrophilus]|uniref:Putative Zn-dependent peptidase n=1 Tax=Desulfovibrio ferrophilus TaxID=241368 RepID=A0A2Z6B0L5_9BACT|nr:pitrilysin family protein [Desulfovibrio ferrophilus]BBD09041.1 putative Zn-dependent peptidase [Desulfovibrio ferrophilus]